MKQARQHIKTFQFRISGIKLNWTTPPSQVKRQSEATKTRMQEHAEARKQVMQQTEPQVVRAGGMGMSEFF